MKKVAIIGSPGSGKSTLAARLGPVLGLPVYHLDHLFWQPGWKRTPGDEWRAIQRKICAESEWIIDGNYCSTLHIRLAACDTAIWLDLPTWVCLLGALRRIATSWGHSRPDMGLGCRERLNWSYLNWIRNFHKAGRPRVLQALKELSPSKKVIVLTSRKEMACWLQKVREEKKEP